MSETSRRPGRPKKAVSDDSGRKGRLLSANISQDLRDALEKEAARQGRSLSQVAERWLEEARAGHATVQQLMGGTDMIPSLAKLGRIAAKVQADNIPLDVQRTALEAAWVFAVPFVLPYHKTPVDFEIETARANIIEACRSVLAALEAASEDDPVRLRSQDGADVRLPGLLNSVPEVVKRGQTIAVLLQVTIEHEAWAINQTHIDYLLEGGSTAKAELEALAAALSQHNKLYFELGDRRRDAASLGRAIAQNALMPTRTPSVEP